MRIALLAAVSLLLLAPPARAATVTGSTHIEGGFKGPEVSVFDLAIAAEPGEASNLTATVSSVGGGYRVEVADTAAAVVPGGLCTPATPTAVVCDGPGAAGRFTVDLGDGNDRFVIVAPNTRWAVVVSAGPGDDDVQGGPFGDSIDGGGGRDVLRGGDGTDRLTDGDAPGAPDGDVIDGGPGDDTVSYAERSGALLVDLSTGLGGEPGELERLISIESVEGGAGADTITGTDGDNSLGGGEGGPDVIVARGGADSVSVAGGRAEGGAGADSIECGLGCVVVAGSGNDDVTGSDRRDLIDAGAGRDEVHALEGDDVVSGGPGNDVLGGGFAEGVAGERDGRDRVSGGAGADRLVDSTEVDRFAGGPGRDLIAASDRRVDRVRCGAGRDRLIGDRRERASGCEQRQVGVHVRFTGSRRQAIVDRAFAVELACPVFALGRCRGRLEARAGGVLVGRGRYREAGDIVADVNLTAAGRALLRGGGTATVTARGGDGTGAVRSVRRVYRLRR